jgi:mannose-1-phosphate guanylyltransferase/mannose-6-phosphate isomerase
MNYAIILAGGIGSRFWPLSRNLEPKQFLNIGSKKSMLEESILRIIRLIKKENIYIAANKAHKHKIEECINEFNLSFSNILFEPEGKNTFAPIGVLSQKIYHIDPEAVIVVLPCDHFVKNKQRFLKLLNQGLEIANLGYIVTLGISPKRPETGYGYIKIKSKPKSTCLAGRQEKAKLYYEVEKIIEKPPLYQAKQFIQDKRYYWNSGIFIFRADVMLEEIRKIKPAVYKTIIKIKNRKDLNNLWSRFPSLSLDYAIMEKTKNAAMLPADYGWLDLGSWQAIEEIAKKDKHKNIFRGHCVDMGSKNSIVWSQERTVATLGLDNLIVVNTEDALLVCAKDKAQDVKRIVQILKRKNCLKQI